MKKRGKIKKIGICRYCEEEKEFCEAHIIPKCFYLNHKLKTIKYQSNTGKPHRNGIWDNSILCGACDKELGKLDNAGCNILLQKKYIHFNKTTNADILYKLDQSKFNYDKIRKFFISVLWRASISKLKDFSLINLGMYEDIALKIIKGEEQNDDLFKILIFKIPIESTHYEELINVGNITKCRKDSIYYKIGMAGYVINIFPNFRGIPEATKQSLKPYLLNKDSMLIIETNKTADSWINWKRKEKLKGGNIRKNNRNLC